MTIAHGDTMHNTELPWEKLTWNTLQNNELTPNRLYEIEIPSTDKCPPISALLVKREHAERVMVLFSSGRPAKSLKRDAHYEMWKQADDIATCHLLYLSDPALKEPSAGALTFGVHEDFDTIANFADAVKRVAGTLGADDIPPIFYGYSQGAFFALQTAAYFPRSMVVARSPILDVEWSSSPPEIEYIRKIFVKRPWQDFRHDFPERMSVIARFLKTGSSPAIILSTSRTDYAVRQMLDFTNNLASISDSLDSIGSLTLTLDPQPAGHSPLTASELMGIMEDGVGSSPNFSVGRESRRAMATPAKTAHPDKNEVNSLHDSFSAKVPLTSKMKWFAAGVGTGSVSINATFTGSEFENKRAIILAFSFRGLTQSDAHRLPLTFSDIPAIGWYRYIKSNHGKFEYNFQLSLPDHVSLGAVGFRLWHYPSTGLNVQDIQVSQVL